MLNREITYNFDDNTADIVPYTYILNTYIFKITVLDNDDNPVDLSEYTYLAGGIGNISDDTPKVILSNFQDLLLWDQADLSQGKIVCKGQLISNDFINDLNTTNIKQYYLQIIGSNQPIGENNFNTICQFPIYTKNTIWRP